ncbi:hypothetical protein EYF80_051952 [Liparis tanakae]|uniref:Uncharacterized protein n=1 Tax=Liparis tanakae TaxID=230148 RepID=A0A4Z2FAG0_9TELE|nr:hypothetical protein EYF80_051952 [Liparis tanakae]
MQGDSCSLQLLPSAAPFSCSPQLLPSAAPFSCSLQLLPSAVPLSCSPQLLPSGQVHNRKQFRSFLFPEYHMQEVLVLLLR